MEKRLPPQTPCPPRNMNSEDTGAQRDQLRLSMLTAAHLAHIHPANNLPVLFPPALFAACLGGGVPLALSQAMGLNIAALQQMEYGAAAASTQSLSSFTTAASLRQPSSITNQAPSPLSDPEIAPTRYSGTLAMNQDEVNLSPYQCLVRQQIEIFEAAETDLYDKSQGRNRPIILNQIGIRCKHCGRQPAKQRGKGAVFFPSQLVGLYQTAQNMANKHLLADCREIPKPVREDLMGIRLKEKGSKTRKSSYGGGRHFWADCLRVLGVEEAPDRRLRLKQKSGG